jgi:hypothetical protein
MALTLYLEKYESSRAKRSSKLSCEDTWTILTTVGATLGTGTGRMPLSEVWVSVCTVQVYTVRYTYF